MKPKQIPKEPCPKCGEIEFVEHKLLTIYFDAPAFREEYALKPTPSTENFIASGLFCRLCEVGFIPDSLLLSDDEEDMKIRGGFGAPRLLRPSRIISGDD